MYVGAALWEFFVLHRVDPGCYWLSAAAINIFAVRAFGGHG